MPARPRARCAVPHLSSGFSASLEWQRPSSPWPLPDSRLPLSSEPRPSSWCSHVGAPSGPRLALATTDPSKWSSATLLADRLPFDAVDTLRSIALFIAAAIAEIGGAWLVWQGVREHRGAIWIGAGVIALGIYGFVATLQPDANFGRILAGYGGVFVAGSLAWGMAADGFKPDRYDILGALICLFGVAVIMYSPRAD